MKKILSVLLAASMLLSFAALLPAGAEADGKPSYEKKELNLKFEDSSDETKYTCLFRSDLPEVPFVSVADYLEMLFKEKTEFSNDGGSVFTLKRNNYSLIIDTEKDTIACDNCESFVSADTMQTKDETFDFFSTTNSCKLTDSSKAMELNLKKYNIDIVASDGKAYMPYCTLNDIFADSYSALIYKNGELMFVKSMSVYGAGNTYSKYEAKRSKAMVEFSYSEMCFVMDCCYGKPSKAVLSESIEKDGFDKTMDNYSEATAKIKKMLLSENYEEYCIGVSVLNAYLDDGGHTNLTHGMQKQVKDFNLQTLKDTVDNNFSDKTYSDLDKVLAIRSEKATTDRIRGRASYQKKLAFDNLEMVKMWDCASLYRTDDTVIFVFDDFLPPAVNAFKESLDFAKDNGVKNFIVDISTNKGGALSVCAYMLKMMRPEAKQYMGNVLTGKTFVIDYPIDKNLDGKTDENDDALKYDLNFAILTTKLSYSAANMLPCQAQDAGVAILGETSGGGCCNTTPRFYADGTPYVISSTGKIVHSDGTDIDGGAEPDTELIGAEKEYEGFYNVEKMKAGVAKFYGLPYDESVPETEAASTEAEKEETQAETSGSEKKDTGDSNGYIFIYICAGALALAAAAAIAVIILKKKKKSDGTTDGSEE